MQSRSMHFMAILAVVSAAWLSGCVTVARSDKRPETPRSIRVAPEVTVTALGAVNIDVPLIVDHADLFPAGFMVRTGGIVLYIDPLIVDSTVPADYILITHPHEDHLSKPDIARIHHDRTVIVGPPAVAEKLPEYEVRVVRPGDRLDLGGIGCEAVPAYNTKKLFLWLSSHPRSAEYVGYVVTVGGVRIYHPGDSDVIPEMERIENITLALVPIDGGKLTMTTDEAASFVNALRPRIAVPMHYELETGEPERVRSLVDESIEVVYMDGRERG